MSQESAIGDYFSLAMLTISLINAVYVPFSYPKNMLVLAEVLLWVSSVCWDRNS